MQNINEIFFGVSPAGCRNFMGEYIATENFDKIIIPCVGRFGIVDAMVSAGTPPAKISTSDICLFSSLLGYFFTDQDLSPLKIEVVDESILLMDEYPVASILFAMKIAQLDLKKYYIREVDRELRTNYEKYIEDMHNKITTIKEKLNGISYEIRDMWDVLREYQDQDVLIHLEPPIYRGDYAKMFDFHDKIIWNEPDVDLFDPLDLLELLVEFRDSKASIVSYVYKNTDMVPEGWKPVFGKLYSVDRTDYLVSNKEVDMRYVERKRSNCKSLNIPIFTEKDVITENSVINFIYVSKEVGEYYRGLFVHRLGAVSAEQIYLMTVDKKVFGVVGLSYAHLFRGVTTYVVELFGITVSHHKYRLSALKDKLLTSTEFRDLLDLKHYDSTGISITWLTKRQNIKPDKKVFNEPISVTKTDTGLWKIKYVVDWRDVTFKDCVIEWLDKNERRETDQRRKRKKTRTSNRVK